MTGAGNGSLTLNTDGSFIYTPNLGFQGTDSFTYYATDGIANSAAASAFIDVFGWGMLRAAGPEIGPAADVAPLTAAELRGVTDAAAARWNRLVTDPSLQQAMRDVTFRITDLPGNLLGLGSAEVVLIDVNAAGYGWFIDATPANNTEFEYQRDVGQFVALPDGDAAGRMDLLTVALHELAHSFGFEDLDPDEYPADLMTSQLDVGVRRLPDRETLHTQNSRLIQRAERYLSATADDGSSSSNTTSRNRIAAWLDDYGYALTDSSQPLLIERGDIDRFFSSRKLLESILFGE